MSIRRFRHKGAQEFFCSGRSQRIGPEYRKRLRLILSALDGATSEADMASMGGFHELKGDRAGTFAVKVTGNYRVTFSFEDGHATDVNFEDYH